MSGANGINKRNGEVEFLRFVMALIIFAYHFNIPQFTGKPILYTGALAVEFFLFVSGFLMVQSMLKMKEKSSSVNIGTHTWLFLGRKLKAIFPELAVSGILAILCMSFCSEQPLFVKISTSINTCINEIFLLKFSGIHPYLGYSNHVWYLSSLMMALAILFPLFFKGQGQPFLLVAALVGIGILQQFNHSIIASGFSWFANLRVLSEVCLGAFAYYAYQKIKDNRWTPLARISCFFLKWGIFIALLICMIIPTYPYNGIFLVLLWLYVILLFSRISSDSQLFDKSAFYFLGKLSLPFYLGHYYVIDLCRESSSWLSLPFAMKFAVCFLLSLCSALIIMALAKQWRQHAAKAVALFVQQR